MKTFAKPVKIYLLFDFTVLLFYQKTKKHYFSYLEV